MTRFLISSKPLAIPSQEGPSREGIKAGGERSCEAGSTWVSRAGECCKRASGGWFGNHQPRPRMERERPEDQRPAIPREWDEATLRWNRPHWITPGGEFRDSSPELPECSLLGQRDAGFAGKIRARGAVRQLPPTTTQPKRRSLPLLDAMNQSKPRARLRRENKTARAGVAYCLPLNPAD